MNPKTKQQTHFCHLGPYKKDAWAAGIFNNFFILDV